MKEELSCHCRRRMRGGEVTLQLIEELLLQLSTATDSLGVPLVSEKMVTIWEEEKKHVMCIQDPPTDTTTTATSSATTGTITGATSTTTDDITPDPRGIPGWDKVGQLAEELVGLTGLGVSAAQANRIKALCDALDSYDKRAIYVYLRSQQPHLRGRFCSPKRTGHTTIEQMRRYVQQHLCMCVCNEVCTTDTFSLGSRLH